MTRGDDAPRKMHDSDVPKTVIEIENDIQNATARPDVSLITFFWVGVVICLLQAHSDQPNVDREFIFVSGFENWFENLNRTL